MEQSEAAKRLIQEALAAHAKESWMDDEEASETASIKDDDDQNTTQRSRRRKIKFQLRDINPYLVCELCAGYFYNATTIMECMHTFCRKCIVDYLYDNTRCPVCNVLVHETSPHDVLRPDWTMQAIVDKILPQYKQAEEEKEAEYNAEIGAADVRVRSEDGDSIASERKASTGQPERKRPKRLADDEICLVLQVDQDSKASTSDQAQPLQRPYIGVSAQATIQTLKKFLALKAALPSPDQVDILCRGEVLGKEYTLEYVTKTRWRKDEQLVLTYRPRENFDLDLI